MSRHRSVAILPTTLAALLASVVSASAQSPWALTIRPAGPLAVGACTPVRLELLDGAGRVAPRTPAGALVSIADFDMTVSSGGAVVGRYDGAGAWSACACPASVGATATITATYPARSLAERARVPGVAFQSSITAPVVAGPGSGVPVGCETNRTTMVSAGREAVPWTTTLVATVSALPIGACSPIQIDLRDATGKDVPRNPAGQRVSIADFDMTVAGAGVVGQSSGATNWSACACQGAAVGARATITATYPARALAESARVPGVAFQSSITLPLAAARGTFNPPACFAAPTAPVAPAVGAPVSAAPPRPVPPAVTAPAPVAVAGVGPVAPAGGPAGAGRGTTTSPVAAPPPAAPTPRTPAPAIRGPVATAAPVPVAPATPRAGGPLDLATVAAPAAAPAPTGVTVTGTPASATLAWQPVAGVASYVVTRQQANVPPAQQTLAATNTGMYDSGLQAATAYTYTVRAIQADGRAASTDVAFTTPPAVNPSGFTATQTGDGQVQLAWQPVGDASYYVLLGPGTQGTKVSGATSYTVTGVPIGPQEWAVASYYEPGPVSTVGTAFTRVQLTVTALLSGWVDLHTHPMVNLAFGGKLVHGGVDAGSLLPADTSCGKGVRATSMAHALDDDRPSHGGWNLVNFPCGDEFRKLLIGEFQQANGALVTTGPARGFPDFNQWPAWNDITHQKMWFEWIRRARDGGLRVMVALATNNKTLGDAVSGPGDGPTDDKASADLQVTEIKAFVGRHTDFMEIALGAADIKRIVEANKIAVVLGVEIDNIGNFNRSPIVAQPMAAAQAVIASEIGRLYAAGVRYVFPVHVMDNLFGGTAIYKNDFNTANLREAGYFWAIECANVADDITHTYVEGSDVLRDVGAFVKLGLDPFRRSGPAPACPGGQSQKSGGHRNARGLTAHGIIAVKEMMKRGMIVDIDHMSQKTADATLDLAETFGYPLVSGHTGIRGLAGSDAENSRTPRQLERLSKLHGMFGLGSDGVHSTAWARLYQTAMIDMGYLNPDPLKATYRAGAVAFGTDLNGLVRGPMPGGGNRVVYDASFPMSSSAGVAGLKAWNYNTDGVAHYGMLADFVRDLRTAPSNGFISAQGTPLGVAGGDLVDKHLSRSAHYFWQMWERIEARKVNVQ